MRRRAILPCLAATPVSGAPGVASAHPGLFEAVPIETSDATLSAGATSWIPRSEASNSLAIFVAGCVLAGILAIRAQHRRCILGVALALMLGLAGFETAIHSVHHLGDSPSAERCLIASTGAHTHAIGGGSPLVPGAATRVVGTVSIASGPLCRSMVAAPTSGRAPPA